MHDPEEEEFHWGQFAEGAANDEGGLVPRTWPTVYDDADQEAGGKGRAMAREAIRGLMYHVFATPTPDAVLRTVFSVAHVYIPDVVDRMTQRDIAKTMGCSPQLFNQRVRRLKKAKRLVGVPKLSMPQWVQGEFSF